MGCIIHGILICRELPYNYKGLNLTVDKFFLIKLASSGKEGGESNDKQKTRFYIN